MRDLSLKIIKELIEAEGFQEIVIRKPWNDKEWSVYHAYNGGLNCCLNHKDVDSALKEALKKHNP